MDGKKQVCGFCNIRPNELIGITCGDILLRGNNTVIRQLSNRFTLSDNITFIDREICYCPVCGRKLGKIK